MKKENHLKLPTASQSEKEYARIMRKHMNTMLRLAFNPIANPEDLEAGELESIRFVTDLMLDLQEIEDKIPAENPP